jgi:YYY domain-containing protein
VGDVDALLFTLYPGLVLLGAWALIELVKQANLSRRPAAPILRWGTALLIVGVLGFTQLWGLMFTNIYRNQLTRVQASHWVWENIPGDFSMTVEDAPPETPLINIAIFNRAGGENDLATQATMLEPRIDYTFNFEAPADGVVREVNIPRLGAIAPPEDDPHSLRVTITTVGGGLLSQGTLTGDFPRDNHPIGEGYTVELEAPVNVAAGTEYVFRAQVESPSQLLISGAIVSNEGAWDDPVPTIVCTMPDGITLADEPPPGLNNTQNCNSRNAYGSLVNGYALAMSLDDIPLKRDNLQLSLDNTDYIIVSSNRFYDGVTRNPGRWPMSVSYYDALFGGELGFEQVAVFAETFELGPLRVPDQHLPHMDAPAWLNEFEAEEAFHVYDHPAVFIFKKTEDYSSDNTRRLLYSQSLARTENITVGFYNDPNIIGVNPLYSLPADETPTQLKLRPDLRDVQYENGTWSERFNRESLINTNPFATVAVWWLVMMLFGFAAFPLTFAMFPMLSDRGYSAAKFVGLLLVAWAAWFLTSLQLRLWHSTGLWLTLGLLAVFSGFVGWRHRADLNTYLRTHWGRLLTIEFITLAAFLFFLGVRLSNPDLWHPSFGGEKPMDFAYFNGVLRSTTFPPIDPWHANGFINYYYFGFVLVGAPVLMLSMIPSIAYNLAIPTVFALTAMGAFSVAFNLVAGIAGNRTSEADEIQPRSTLRLTGSPWTAGIAALLLAVVLGNLNIPRVFVGALAGTSSFVPAADISEFMVNDFVNRFDREPTSDELMNLLNQASDPSLVDQARYTFVSRFDGPRMALSGLRRVVTENQPLALATHRWYWASTRVLAEPPVSSGGAITEIPYFTFLYGDLHAHMISMPMQLFILLFLMHEVFNAGRNQRRALPTVLAVGVGALSVGMLQATNTWDWPTYLLLGVLGMGFVWWLTWRGFSRAALIDMLLRVGGFITLSVWLSLPYTRWYAATYGAVSAWEGPKTPIWAYLVIHGLFVFLLLSLLVWETNRWMRSVRVRDLRGRGWILYSLLALAVFVPITGLGLTIGGWRVSILLIPMIVWAVVLFFRPNQSREMQFALVIAALALSVTLGVEYIVIDGDIGRMNTVFKFYLQSWLMFAVIGGAVVAWLLDSVFEWNWPLRSSWLTVLGLLVGVAALYPLMATQARALDRMAPEIPLTLDGMAYMEQAQHYEVVNSALGQGEVLDLEYDYNIIRWLQDNVEGTPIIMEAQSEAEYRWGSRIAIYTGLPTIVGWNHHQRQQRTFSPMPQMVNQRAANVNHFYTTEDIQVAANILQAYDVKYVIVGSLERARYGAGIDKFWDMVDAGVLNPVYSENNFAVIFEVNRIAAQQMALGLEITETASEVARVD